MRSVLWFAVAVSAFLSAGTFLEAQALIFADGFETGGVSAWTSSAGYEPTPIIDLRADVNRNGTIDLADPTEDLNEDTWDFDHGAIFLANIDDDESACPTTGTDEELAACNDAADEIINGSNDLIDLARLKTVPWLEAPDDAGGSIVLPPADAPFVRLFREDGGIYSHFDPVSDSLTADDLRAGVEFAIEAVDIVRNLSTWSGFVDVTLDVDAGTGPGGSLPDGSDTVRLRVAPVLFRHHLEGAETVYASAFATPESTVFRNDLKSALSDAGVSNPLTEFWDLGDQWTQDFFETAIMSMPAVSGSHTIHVNFRSANYTSGGLRSAGRIVFTDLRGPDVAGAVQYDPAHSDYMDTLDSFGNLETIPPYDNGVDSWPLGRVIRGGTPDFYPDPSFDELVDAQGMQPVTHFDTEWLYVGHIDETLSFLPAATPRGWVVLAADVTAAWNALVDAQTNGYGNTPMFVGLLDPWGNPAETTINQAVTDVDLFNANVWAAAEVTSQVDQLMTETGVEASEIISGPFLMFEYSGWLVAWVPGLVNGVVLPNAVYAPPDPHGPVINATDLFKDLLEQSLVSVGYTVSWVEDWDLYHIFAGEVHCGSNATHELPVMPWWESMQ